MTTTPRGGASDELQGSYHALSGELRGIFRRRGIPADEASDLAQETIVRTLVHIRRHGRTSDDVRPLVHTIARNLLVSRVRRRRPDVVPLTTDEDVVDESRQPLDEVIDRERTAAVRAALGSLSPRHRRVVSMWMEGLTPGQIARELGIKRNAADALLHRARRSLAARLRSGSAPLGVAGLLSTRLRSGLRRVADAVGTLDPSGSLIHATSGLAAVGIVAAASFASSIPSETSVSAGRSGSNTITVGVASLEAATVAQPDAPSSQPLQADAERGEGEIVADIREHRAEAGTGAATRSDEGDDGVGVEHERDDGGESQVGNLIYTVTDEICSESTQICRGDQ